MNRDILSQIAEWSDREASLWHSRTEIVDQTTNTFHAIFESEDVELTHAEREAAAVWSATLAKATGIAEFHRSRLHNLGEEHLAQIGTSLEQLDLSARDQAILRHVELLTLRPATATEGDLTQLQNAGLTARAVVELTHLVAFLAFEIRTIAVIRAIAGGDQ